MVEVILCTFNGTPFVGDQLRSILHQSHSIDAISIYDDRSTDDTVDKVNKLVSSLPTGSRTQIKIVENERNVGYARNFEQGIARATGDILFLSDQDDIWERDKVEVLMGLSSQKGVQMAFSDGTLVDDQGMPLAGRSVLERHGLDEDSVASFQKRGFDFLLRKNYINGAALAVRREAAQSAMPIPPGMPHDYWLALFCSLGGGLVGTARKLYRYRQHGGNEIGIGSDRFRDLARSVVRHPRVPRERELERWVAIWERLEAVDAEREASRALAKVQWLQTVVAGREGVFRRAIAILTSALRGQYREFSDDLAVWRDLVSLVRR